MPTYFRPSVYFEESLRPLSDSTSDPAEAGAAFVGKAKAGPAGPNLVTSWPQFQSLYGSISYETNDLAYAVYSYFANGGRGAYIVRGIPSDATAASLLTYDGTGTTLADEVFTATAKAPGTWSSDAASANRVFVSVKVTTSNPNRFDLVIDIGTAAFLSNSETFVDLSMDPADPRYALDVVNSPAVGSKFVVLTRSLNIVGNAAPGEITKAPLTGGTEGVAAVNLVTAAATLEQIDRNMVINVPGASSADVIAITNWAVAGGRHVIVADVLKPAANETATASALAMTTFADTLPNTSHLAVYGPWVWMADPGSSAGALRLTAPGGAVVAQYLRTDASRGVHKAPAGVATSLAGVIQPYALYSNTEQDELAKTNVNLIKTVPGSGVVIWGARTQANGAIDRYVPIRRLLISVKSSLNAITRFAIFENIDDDLRAQVEERVRAHLQMLFDTGAFKGSTPQEAFFVRCDASNNPPAVEEAGQVIIDVGVALKTPAEFIVIRIGQQQSGTTASDSLEEI